MKVQNNILTSIDQHGIVKLILFGLSAAFDALDHDVLFSRMESTLVITGPTLEWFHSYVGDRTLRDSQALNARAAPRYFCIPIQMQ